MTKRTRLIEAVATHLRGIHPSRMTAQKIEEAITELELDKAADTYDWSRLYPAVARLQHEKYTRINFKSNVTQKEVPALM